MNKTARRIVSAFFLFLLVLAVSIPPARAQDPPVARAVLFWMDGCDHCHLVLDEVLPPLQAQYGAQLDILLVEIRTLAETDQFYALGEARGLTRNEVGVPLLLIGDGVLVGRDEIKRQLTAWVDAYLAAGGVALPPFAELTPLLPADVETAVPPAIDPPALPAADGFVLAVIILVGLFGALLYSGARLTRAWQGHGVPPRFHAAHALLPLLALTGLGVAAYLAYVETQAVPALCGPVGDCNAVQTSPYASLFGIPVGVLGVAGYVAILAVWGWGRFRDDRRAAILLPALTGLGLLFSIYLTILEPFVIGAVCAWCLTSAVVMGVLWMLSVETAVPHLPFRD